MKMSDYKTVEKLIDIRDRLLLALADIEEVRQHKNFNQADSGGLEGFELGYNAHFSLYADGSGPSVNMSGCYVQHEVLDAIAGVLHYQLNMVHARLHELGIEDDVHEPVKLSKSYRH